MCHPLQVGDQPFDFLGRVVSATSQGADFVSHNSETATLFTGTGGLDRCVER